MPTSIYRVKGVIYAAEVPMRRAVLQVAGKRVDISLLDELGHRMPRSRIVAIGTPSAFKGGEFADRLHACIGDAASTNR